MGKLEDDKNWLRKGLQTLKPGSSSAPKTSSANAAPTMSPPPAYQTVAPAAMPSTSKALARKENADDWDNDERRVKYSSNRDNDQTRRARDDDDDRYGASRHRPRDPSADSRDGGRDQQLVKRSKSLRNDRRGDRSESETEFKHKSRRERENMELIKDAKSSKQKQRADVSESDSESDRNEKQRRKSNKKESKAVVKHKSSKQREESESESESDRPKKRKEKSSKHNSKALVKAKSSKKHEESDPESSNEEIIEKRTRYENLDFDELPHTYVIVIADIWEVTPRKVEGWCDTQNLIRLDTTDGSINLDKLIKKESLEAGNEKELAMFQKREKRWIAEHPGGYMNTIRRFKKGSARSQPSSSRCHRRR